MSEFDKLLEEELEKRKKKKERQSQLSKPLGNSLSYLPSYSTLPAKDVEAVFQTTKDKAIMLNKANKESILGSRELDEAAGTVLRSRFGSDDDDEATWFKSGAFDDGYQFGDVTKTILGTVGDAGRNVLRGVSGVAEGLNDLAIYGVASVVDKFGDDDRANKIRAVAQEDETTRYLGGSGDWLDQYSVLGRIPDSVFEGVGQAGLIMATGGAGSAAGLSSVGVSALTTGTMGLSGMGRGMSEAFNDGATPEEAELYGLISGVADAGTELIFGGMGKGVNALGFSKGLSSADDMLAKAVSSKIKNTIAKNAVEFGIKAGAEGLEEVMAGFLQALGKKATYMSEKDFDEILADENLLEQFIVGALTSGVTQSGDFVRSNKSGTDFITGYTQDDQAIFDKVVKDRIAEMEAEGKKVTAKDKADIKGKVAEDLEMGRISTKTIEEVLGGDQYTEYQNAIQSENEALAELAELYEGDELKLKTEEFLGSSKRSELEKALSDSVFDRVKNSKISESYLEKARRGQRFTADLTKYDEKQRVTVQKAIESGVLNNTNRTRDMVEWIARVSADTGVSFDFTNNEKLKDSIFAVDGKTVDGYITKDGVVINVNSRKYINTVVGHEITHALEGTKLYDALESAVFEYAKANGTYKDVLKSAYDMYHGEEGYQGYEGLKAIKKEAVANMVGDYLFTDKNFISHLSAKNPNIFQKVWNEIKYMVKVARAGSDEAKKLIQVQKAFEEAYRSGGNTQSENSSGNIKYSLENNGKRKYNKRSKYSETETLFLRWENGSTPVGEVKKFSRFGKTRYYEKTESGSVELSKQQYIERNKVYAENTYRRAERRFGTTADYDETTQRGLPGDHISYRDTSGDAAVFGQTIREKLPDVTRGSESSTLRDGTGNADIKQTEYNEEASAEEQDASFVTFSNDYATIRNFMKDGDTPVKYSLSKDSDGKQLTKEQQEYFKDSKVRDESGNLKAMYHGTSSGGFHTFQHGYSDDDTSFFFVDNNGVASTYSGTTERYEAQTLRTAEDFNRFFAEIGASEYEVTETDGKFTLLEDGDEIATSDTADGIYEEFRDWSGKGYGAVNYKVYLNLKNPLEVDADGREWNALPNVSGEATQYEYIKMLEVGDDGKVTIEYSMVGDPAPVTERVDLYEKFEYGLADTLSNLAPGESVEGVYANPSNTRDYAQYAKKNGYDGVIFKNIYDIGGWGGSHRKSTVAIAFESNQIKSVANTQPTGNPDIRYSLSEDSKKLKDVGLDYDSKNETVSYSMSSLEDAFDYNKSEADYLASRLEYETALAKSIAEDKENVTQEEMDKAKRYLDSLFLIHDMIAMDRDRLDYEAAVGKSAWVSNAEYGGSIDFSTLCAKRRLFTGTFDAIQNEMPDTVLDENDFLQIRNLLLEKELESPCSMCYVEGSRAKHGVYVAKFLKEYKQTNPQWMPQIADFTSTIRLEQTRINHPEAYQAYVDAMNKLSQRKPKEASVRTDYRGEILRDFKDTSTVAEKNKNGGVRFNSFSDFEIIHAIDCMQVLTDMSRVGLNGQAYTKVKEFAEAFGNTGLKINLSLVAKDVDANGKLIMDETNGMKYDEAMDIRNRYSENVGTVIVVFNETQLRAALADNTIDYVLPFHRSQWKKSQYTMMGLPTNTKDFTNFQNDRIKNPSTGRDVKLSKIKHISQYTNDITGETFEIKDNIMPNQYWDFNLDGRANAQRYLDYINANGMTPKFSFLLNKVDGKWVLPADAVGDGYFKLLIDFKMYNNDGWGSPQNPVVPEFNMPFIQKMLEDYKGGHKAFPVAHDVVSKFVEGKKSGKYSLSNEDALPTKHGNYHVKGEDIAYEEMLPMAQAHTKAETPVVAPQIAQEPVEDMFPDMPVQQELENLRLQQQEILGGLEAAVSMGDYGTMSSLTTEYEDVTNRIRALEAQEESYEADRLNSIDEADAPPEMDSEHYEVADTTPLNKKTVMDLSSKVKNLLGIKNHRTGEVVSMIEAYSRSENPSSEQLFHDIKEKFGTYTEKTGDDTTKEVKALLRGYRINVSESIKSEIADYADLMRRNFGKVRFSKDGMNVDEVYEDLHDSYPGYFPESIDNPTDQLLHIIEVANMEAETVSDVALDDEAIMEAVSTIARTVSGYKRYQMETLSNRESKAAFDSLLKEADSLLPMAETPVKQKEVTAKAPVAVAPNAEIKTVKERLTAKLTNVETELANNRKLRGESWTDFDNEIARAKAEYNAKSNKNTVAANDLLRRIERLNRMKHSADADYAKRISDLETKASKVGEEIRTGNSPAEQGAMRQELHNRILSNIRSRFEASGFDFDTVLKNAKNLSTFATVDNTPQRVMEKALGYKQGKILSDITVDQVARNETQAIQWLNSFTDRKSGLLKQISKKYSIKPGSKESAAAQMYAEGFYVNGKNEIVQYGDAELALDFPDASVQKRIKGLARDPRIRQIYDETLAKINESRARNAYPEIPKLDNYFLHFRAMDDTFSRLGLPFNPNDIKAKDLPTDLNGVTADLKPGQPYFASAMHRTGKRTSFDLLGGLERYLSSAKNQIYHIDDIQTLRALRNYVADTYGQAKGLESLDLLTEEEAQERIKQVYGSHLSTFAKFLNEEANVIAGKTALIDRGLEGIIGRRGITFLNTVNQQVGKNMVGFNVSSSLTNFLAPVQAFAKTNKFDFVKAMAQTTANKVGSIFGKGDGFADNSPVMIRRKGAESFYRTPWQKAGDAGYVLMSAVDNISTELIARAKYNELTRKGMDSQTAHIETDKWVSRLMGDRSLGQQPQLYNSKMLGIVTKFQLEVRNQLDSQFYDTIQEEKVSNEHIQNGLLRNAKTAAKVTSTFFQLAVAQHLFGKAFESVAGYNPAFDIISVIAKMFGWDDEEDDEDTVLDNIEEGLLELLGDLPYTSTLTGGRIPISSALPIEEFINGKDQYGNEKSRWETLGEAVPYYLLPGGYGQIKKTKAGLDMFSDEHPVPGSYTDSGNLRFPVEDTPWKRVQAALFGQYASENARDYFDNDRQPLKPKQIQEYIDSQLPISDYWEYREGLSGLGTLDAKGDYIGGLDLPISTKNLFINNIAGRSEDIDMTNYHKYPNFSEFDWAEQNKEKYAFLREHGMSYADYEKLDEDSKSAYSWAFNNPEKYAFIKGFGLSATDYYSLDDDSKDAYTWAYNNPESYTFSRSVTDDVVVYRQYARDLNAIKADKDEDGKSISGSRKDKVFDYIMGLDIDDGAKAILFKSEYPSEDSNNEIIIDYLNGRDDISAEEMVAILKKLGFTVDSEGYISW